VSVCGLPVDVYSTRSTLINLNRIARSYLELHWKALRFLLSCSVSPVAILPLCPLCCGSVTAGPVNDVTQNSAAEALVPTTTKLLLKDPLTDGGVHLQLFRLQGEGVEWSPDGKWVVNDCKHRDGYYNIHLCRVDGTEDRSLTKLNNGLPHRDAGSPTWHPTGRYIAFAAEKKVHQGGSVEATPGFGGRSDIWVMLADGSKAWQLTQTEDTKSDGVLLPKFSHDGTRLAWTERVGTAKFFQPRAWFSEWVIKVADFVTTPTGPQLTNILTLRLGGPGFYEAYGFSPNDRQIIFCSDFDRASAFNSQIFVMDSVDGSHVRCLTRSKSYNEHASFSPDGRHIVWMSSQDNRNNGTDWWLIDADGSHQRRLTHFNLPGYPEGSGVAVFAGLVHWAPNGVQLLGGVQYSLLKQEGRIMLMTWTIRSLASEVRNASRLTSWEPGRRPKYRVLIVLTNQA
jgi:Tol biopolymer transport system component